MHILLIDHIPLHQIPYRYVRPGGSKSVGQLAVHVAYVDRLPASIDAIVVTADLQARELSGDRLLAEVLAQELCVLADLEVIPSTSRIGVVLAGDFFARQSLDKRGGLGDVRVAWHRFALSFRWVTGVPGNHDSFGETHEEEEAFRHSRGVHFLDGDAIELDEIRFAGIGGIIGKPSKPQRRDETHFIRCLRDALESQPDICVLHQGPDVPDNDLHGEPAIRKRLLAHKHDLIVVCGHSHWSTPLAALSSCVQVLNVDMRVIILMQLNVT